jgi:hypothetical protein
MGSSDAKINASSTGRNASGIDMSCSFMVCFLVNGKAPVCKTTFFLDSA